MSYSSLFSKSPAKFIAVTGLTAALYMAATLAIAPLGYEAIQFRISEIMVLLAYVDFMYAPGLILGCALSNLFSPLGPIDVVFGTLGTACTMFAITHTKNLFVATLWPTVFCIFVGIELMLVNGLPLLATTASVMIGEFAVVTLIGYPLFKTLLKNKPLAYRLKISNSLM